jgi:hypothetical protein
MYDNELNAPVSVTHNSVTSGPCGGVDGHEAQAMQPSPLAEQLQTKRTHIKHLIATAAAANGVTYEAIMSRARPRDVCRARFDAIAAVSAAYPDMSFPRIGKIFNRDHSSIVHALMMRGVQPRSGRIAEYRKFAALMARRAVGTTQTEGENRNENT